MDESERVRRVALLVEDDFDGREVLEPLQTLRAAGVNVVVVGPTAGTTYRGRKPGAEVTAELAAGKARIEDFDAVDHSGRLRAGQDASAPRDGRPGARRARGRQARGRHRPRRAAADHGERAARDRTLTCWPSIAIDVKNAGGHYVDRPVVEDGNMITSRQARRQPRVQRGRAARPGPAGRRRAPSRAPRPLLGATLRGQIWKRYFLLI